MRGQIGSPQGHLDVVNAVEKAGTKVGIRQGWEGQFKSQKHMFFLTHVDLHHACQGLRA